MFAVELAKQVQRVIIIDHHKTAFELVDKLKAENNLPHNCTNLIIQRKHLSVKNE